MLNRLAWFKSRKIMIFSISIDYFFILFLLEIQNFNLNDKFKLNLIDSIFILLIWVTISYFLNRYYSYDFTQIKKLSEKLFSTLLKFLLSYITFIFFIEVLVKKFFINYNLSFLFIIFPICSGLVHFLLINSKNKFVSYKEKWIYIGKIEEFKKLNNILKKESKQNIDLFYYKFKKNNSEYYKDYDGIILNSSTKNAIIEVNDFVKVNIPTLDLLQWCQIYINRIPSEIFSTIDLVKIHNKKNNFIEERLKRFGDIFISLFLIICSLPFVLLICILIKLEDNGPLLYVQKRIGKDFSVFNVYKLRSMKINSEKNGAEWSNPNDKRITKVGKIIRKTRIDELPQLFSVISGDMSLIGPRPERPEFYEILKDLIPNFALRSKVKPGLSGWAQVNYPYGSSVEDSLYKLSYDLYYMSNFSFFLDFLILIKTIKIIINANGR